MRPIKVLHQARRILTLLLLLVIGLGNNEIARSATTLKVYGNIKIGEGNSIVVQGNLNTFGNIEGKGKLIIDANSPVYLNTNELSVNMHGKIINNLEIRNGMVALSGPLAIYTSLTLKKNSFLILNQYNLHIGTSTKIMISKTASILQNDIGMVIIQPNIIAPILPLSQQRLVSSNTKIIHSTYKKIGIVNFKPTVNQKNILGKVYYSIILDIPIPPPKYNV